MATATDSTLVLVTGASGYIASHVVKQLQEEGYRVRGTVRSTQDEAKVKHLQEMVPDAQYKLELVEADLTKPESWDIAVKDAAYVIHVASPFPASSPKDENEVIQPAVDGTQSVLKACVMAKSVKRVVLTSSIAAISGGVGAAADKVYTEEDWVEVDKCDPYAKSKTLAEKAAWDYVKELPDEDKIELTTINPGYVMGPVLHNTQCTSMEVVKRLLERSMPAVPKLNFAIIDVRDVAAAHIKAMTNPDAAGKRHIVFNQTMWMKEMAQILSKEFKPQGHRHVLVHVNMWMRDVALMLDKEFKSQGYSVPTMNCPYIALWAKSLFDSTIKMVLPQVGKVSKFDNSRMKDVLGITPFDPKDTLIDMAYSMIEKGFVKKSKKYRGPNAGGEEKAETPAEGEKKEEEADEKPKENGDVKEESPKDGGEESSKTPASDNVEDKKPEEDKKAEEIKEEKKVESTGEKIEDGK